MQRMISNIYALVLPLFALCLQACVNNHAVPTASRQQYQLPDSLFKRLQTAGVTTSEVTQTVNLTGKITFNDDKVIKIFHLVSGIAQDIKVMLGDYVRAGQPLGTIRSSEMAGYTNDLITARTNLDVAEKNWDATADMYKSGLASSRDYLAAQAGYEQAEASLEKAQRILNLNGGRAGSIFTIKSPISGYVVEKFVNNNTAIRPDNTNNLFTVSNLKDVWVVANVYESNIPYVHAGDTVQVTTLSYPDRIFTGKIDKVMNVLDPTNKVAKVRIVLPNPDLLLKPEMFANVLVNTKPAGSQRMLAVPSKALIFDNSQYYVVVCQPSGTVSIRQVQVEGAAGGRTYVASGLLEGEKVVTSDPFLIYQQLNN